MDSKETHRKGRFRSARKMKGPAWRAPSWEISTETALSEFGQPVRARHACPMVHNMICITFKDSVGFVHTRNQSFGRLWGDYLNLRLRQRTPDRTQRMRLGVSFEPEAPSSWSPRCDSTH